MTDFSDYNCLNIAQIAADHVHAWERVYELRAEAQMLPATAPLLQQAQLNSTVALAVARAEKTWEMLVVAVLEAEGEEGER